MTLLSSIIGGGTSTSSGISELEIKADEMSLDDTIIGVDYGTAFNMYPTCDFGSTTSGAIWIDMNFPSGWSITKDIVFEINYSLNGVDNTKNMKLNANIWSINNAEVPLSATPDTTLTDTIISASTNTNTFTNLALTNIKVPLSILTASTESISIQLLRDVTVASNYSGTFQLISVRAKQI